MCKYSKLNLNIFALSCCISSHWCSGAQLLSEKIAKLHQIYGKIKIQPELDPCLIFEYPTVKVRRCPCPSRGTSANIRINLIPPETRIIGLHFCCMLIVWVYLHSNFYGGLRKMHLFCNRVRISRSRSSKVVDFGTNRKGVCDFLLVISSNFGPILHRF